MARGGPSYSGRALRFVLWRAPVGAGRYAMARNMALATEEGRRWLILGGTLFWVWVIWMVAGYSGVQGFQELAAFLWLLWFWRLFVNLRRVWVNRRNLKGQARGLQYQRQMYEMQAEALSQMRRLAAGAGRQVSEGGVDVLNLFRTPPDPVTAEQQQTRRQQAEEIRSQLPEESRDIPLGDRPEPVIPMPRWLRRRGPK
jgi:hypothetical protein